MPAKPQSIIRTTDTFRLVRTKTGAKIICLTGARPRTRLVNNRAVAYLSPLSAASFDAACVYGFNVVSTTKPVRPCRRLRRQERADKPGKPTHL